MYFVCCSSVGVCHFCITFKSYLIGHKTNFCCLGKILGCEMMTFRKKIWILLCLFSYRGWLLKHVLITSIQEHLIFLSYLEKKKKKIQQKKLLRLMVFCTSGYYYTCLRLSTLQTIVRKLHLFSKSHRRTDVELSFKQCTVNHLHLDTKWTGTQWELIGCFVSWPWSGEFALFSVFILWTATLKTVIIYEQDKGLFQIFNCFYRAKTIGDHLNGDGLY